MKKLYLILVFSFICNNIFAAAPVGTNISKYPNTNVAPAMGMLLVAVTNDPGAFPRTNYNVTISDFALQLTNGLASISYVLTASNNLFTTTTVVSNGVITQIITASNNLVTIINNSSNFLFSSLTPNLWTNSQGIVRLTTNGPVSIASTGLLGNLTVTQDMRILGHNAASNNVWTATNATTGEGEWRTVEALVAFRLGLTNDPDRLILQALPIKGALYYTGTNGYPNTNGQRRGMEVDFNKASIRIGSVGNIGVARHNYIAESNYWNDANVQIGSSILGGSNCLVNAIFSTIGGGVGNHIYTNAGTSFIGGGTNNYIRTNSINSVIGGGNFNTISVDCKESFIGGGVGHEIKGGSIQAVIVGGNTLSIGGLNFGGQNYAFMGGGLNNTLGDEASGTSEKAVLVGGELNRVNGDYSFLGGGNQNTFVADCDYSTIVGGLGNGMGANPNSGVLYAFIGGGRGNGIANNAESSVISGGRDSTISANSSNSFIGGGYLNLVNINNKFAIVPGGEGNTISATYATALGTSNNITANRAMALGMNVTNNVADSVIAGEFRQYNTPVVIAGTGNGNTNYTLNVNTPEMILGSSNVNILASMSWIDGKTHKTSLSITNLSTDNWGFSFSSVSNRVKWQSWMYGTNAPIVLTNNTMLRIDFTWTGSNGLAEYKYFRPAL